MGVGVGEVGPTWVTVRWGVPLVGRSLFGLVQTRRVVGIEHRLGAFCNGFPILSALLVLTCRDLTGFRFFWG